MPAARLPDEVAEHAFVLETARVNLERTRLALMVLTLVHVVHVVIFWLLVPTDTEPVRAEWSHLIGAAHAVMIVPAIVVAWLARKMLVRPARWRRVPVLVAATYVCLTALLVSFDQLVVASPIAFVTGTIGLAVILRFGALEALIVFALGVLVVVVGVELMQQDPSTRRFVQVNCFAVGAVSVIIARSYATLHRQLFFDRRTIERQARTDALTGALTRGAFMMLLDKVRGEAASLVLLDVDNLKTINDRSGHAAGDAVLVAVARAARASIRGGDALGRIGERDHLLDEELGRLGGDELAVLLPRADLAAASMVAERIRGAVAQTGSSVSLGVATRDLVSSESIERWLARADEALYRAKRDGRDRVAT